MADVPLDVLDRVARLVGDRWSMLVLGALSGGGRRYGELSAAVEGISSNVLAARLSDLAAAGLIVGEPYSSRPDRLRYELTAEGRALVDALAGLAAWERRRAQATGTTSPCATRRAAGRCGRAGTARRATSSVAPGDDTGVFQA